MFSRWILNESKIVASRMNFVRHRTLTQSSPVSVFAKKSAAKRFLGGLAKFSLLSVLGGIAYVSYELYKESNPSKQIPQNNVFSNGSPKKTMVILGSGWGSISLLKNLDTSQYNVIVVSPRSYFLFTPLLPSTPVGTVELKSIVEPVRCIARRTPGEVVYYEAEALDVDPSGRSVKIRSVDKGEHTYEIDLKYDYLVVGVGAEPATFNIPGVYENAHFLKEVSDAQNIRTKIMRNVETAITLPRGDPERKRLLSFVVVGGGPTGVEFAAELQDYIQHDLSKWMPDLFEEIKISLFEGLPNILNMFEKSMWQYTQDLFKEKNIELRLNTMVKNVGPTHISAKCGDEIQELPYGLLVWATGNIPRQFTKVLMTKLEQNSKSGLLINDKLQLLGAEDSVFAVGDCTFYPGLAPTAQVAHQEGEYLANVFKKQYKIDQLQWQLQNVEDKNKAAMLETKIDKLVSQIQPFKYKHHGVLAYVGSEKAIVDLVVGESKYSFAGNSGFLFWKSSYLSMCLTFKNRILVALDWMKVFLLGRDSSV